MARWSDAWAHFNSLRLLYLSLDAQKPSKKGDDDDYDDDDYDDDDDGGGKKKDDDDKGGKEPTFKPTKASNSSLSFLRDHIRLSYFVSIDLSIFVRAEAIEERRRRRLL
jgi:hypothetical protein